MLEFVVAALAVWRVSVLLVEEDGPWDIIWHLRDLAGIRKYADGTVQIPRTFGAGVLTCVRCASVWLAVLATLVLWPGDDWQAWVLLPPALSGAAVAIEVFRR